LLTFVSVACGNGGKPAAPAGGAGAAGGANPDAVAPTGSAGAGAGAGAAGGANPDAVAPTGSAGAGAGAGADVDAAGAELGGAVEQDPGTEVMLTAPAALLSGAATERAALAADRPDSAAAFAAQWKPNYLAALPYDPTQATGLDLVQASNLALDQAELSLLATNGFVVSARQSFPTFFMGYKAIYAAHLPLYVSLDSVLHAVHRSYDAALETFEVSLLQPELSDLLVALHGALASGGGAQLPAEVRADVDLFLTVARELLGQQATPVAGADPAAVAALVAAATAGVGLQDVDLFGQTRTVDFSQFTPRGHYLDDPTLTEYFRAMMWLGRTDFRFLQYDTDAPPTAPAHFYRRQFLDGLLLATLSQGAPLDEWKSIDDVLHGFVGESDNMNVADFSRLPGVAGVSGLADLPALSDQALGQALLDGGFGIQRIASQLLSVGPNGSGVPLDRVFLFMGQRFVIDSEVFSDLVFDRVATSMPGAPQRMLPNPLDVGFAALGNTAAAPLLASELTTYESTGYPGALHDVRELVDAHGSDFWDESLYSAWLLALRGLSAPAGDPTTVAGLPSVMKTEPWSRRILNTQLASWAELRHDTLLYAKQSYTARPNCDFPDAFVDPYPDAWGGIVLLAQLGQQLVANLPAQSGTPSSTLGAYFAEVATDAALLRDMASEELAGQPLTADQLAFINQAVDETLVSAGCTQVEKPTGWYVRLFENPSDVLTADPTIADVHTDPAEGLILHVATGSPRLLVVTADGCDGPRAYAGLASSYYELTTQNLQRLNDDQWAVTLTGTPAPADVSWMADVLAP
jgi:uncharacterized protein DUF3160